jgi:hypothetical protein
VHRHDLLAALDREDHESLAGLRSRLCVRIGACSPIWLAAVRPVVDFDFVVPRADIPSFDVVGAVE